MVDILIMKFVNIEKMKRFLTTFALIILAQFGKAQTENFSMKDVEYTVPVSYVTLSNDIEVAYSDLGTGSDVILFIHGLGSYLPAWQKNIDDLKSQYRCIAIDLPGYGKSSKGNYQVSMDFFADIVKQVCDKLKISQIILTGHSMGGQIAISTALKCPSLVKKLVLIAPAGFETFNKGERQWFKDVMTVDGVKLTTAEQIRTNYAYNFYEMPKDADFMIADRLKIRGANDFTAYCYHITQGVNAMVDSPVFEYLKNVTQPTLCIFGANDNLIPNRFLNGGFTEKYAKEGANQMPNCKLHMVNKAGHFVMFEKSAEVNNLIKDFIKPDIH